MTVAVSYVTDPPQVLRGSQVAEVTSYAYEVGDRLTAVNGSGYTYRCTTAGVSGTSGFPGAGGSPVTWGTSVWTLITTDSWANAASTVVPYLPVVSTALEVIYIDAYSTAGMRLADVAHGRRNATLVFVDKDTMVPTYQRPVFTGVDSTVGVADNYSYATKHFARGFFESLFANDFFRRAVPLFESDARLVPGGFSGDGARSTFVGPTVAAESWGNNVTSYVNSPGSPSTVGGIAGDSGNTHQLDGTHLATDLITISGNSEYAHYLPKHADTVFAGAVSTTYVANFNMPHVLAGSHNTASAAGVAVERGTVNGSRCALVMDPTVYRSGVWPAGVTPVSYVLVATGVTPWGFAHTAWMQIMHQTTGAVTLTVYFAGDYGFPSLTDVDVWLEAMYGNSSTSNQYGFASGINANFGAPEAVGAAHATDTSAWVVNPAYYAISKFKLTLSFSISRALPVWFRICVASPKVGASDMFMCPIVTMA